MLKIAICDDNISFLKYANDKIIANFKDLLMECNVRLFSLSKDLLKSNLKMFDIVFLDIEMDVSGIEVAAEISKISPNTILIFISSHIKYAPQGYQVSAFRYILKDDFDKSITFCVKDIAEKLNQQNKVIKIKVGTLIQTIDLNEVAFFESQKRKIIINYYDNNKQNTVFYGKLKELEYELHKKGFIKVHKSFLVNLDHIKSIERFLVTLKNGVVLNVSQSNYKNLNNRFILHNN